MSDALVACPYFCCPPDLLEIPAGAFQDCATLTELTLPAAVTAIGVNGFRGSKLTKINLPTSLTSIGDDAFRRCSSLTELTLPAALNSIGDGAFAGCSLVKLTLRTALTTISAMAH